MQKQSVEKNRKINTCLWVSVLLFLTLCLSVTGVTYAYLHTDPGKAVNVITVGEIDIELQEKNWNPKKAAALHPKETVSKDPVVVNMGSNSAYVFLEVAIPMKDFSTVGENGKKESSKIQTVCSFLADTSSWELLEQRVWKGKQVLVYGYRSRLEPGEATQPLFTELVTANYLEGSIDPAEIFSVDITAKAIQDTFSEENQTMQERYQTFADQWERDHSAE